MVCTFFCLQLIHFVSAALMFVVTSQDFFDSRVMEAIRKQLTFFSINCDVSGNDITFQHAVCILPVAVLYLSK